jgi:hypothetical protein
VAGDARFVPPSPRSDDGFDDAGLSPKFGRLLKAGLLPNGLLLRADLSPNDGLLLRADLSPNDGLLLRADLSPNDGLLLRAGLSPNDGLPPRAGLSLNDGLPHGLAYH